VTNIRDSSDLPLIIINELLNLQQKSTVAISFTISILLTEFCSHCGPSPYEGQRNVRNNTIFVSHDIFPRGWYKS